MNIQDSILNSVKKMNNIGPDYDAFDTDMILCINQAFASLTQMGVGPITSFMIDNAETKWDEYSDDEILISLVKPYISLRVRQIFDPPTSSALSEAINERVRELEFRLRIQGGDMTSVNE